MPNSSSWDVDPSEDESADRVPTVRCSRCEHQWELSYELDTLQVGNRALEQFAIDHHRHTGHFPDDATPWQVECRRCPDGEEFLSRRPAQRWGKAHARHTGHDVVVRHVDADPTIIEGCR